MRHLRSGWGTIGVYGGKGGGMKNLFEGAAQKQQALLDSLLALARRQLEMVKANADEDALAMLLRDRSALMKTIQAGDADLRKFAEEAKREDHPAVEKLQTTVAEILALDGETGRLLQDRKSGVFVEIRNLSKGSTALKGYGGKGSGPARFINKKG